MAGDLGRGEVMQRMDDHLRAEIRAADADVHDVPDPPPGVAGPGAVAHRVGETRHLRALGRDLRVERRVGLGRAQRGVQRRAAFGRVHDLAREHRIAARCDPRLAGQLHEQAQRRIGDAILREIGGEPAAREREALGAGRGGIVGRREPVAQVRVADLGIVRLQGVPGGERVQRHGSRGEAGNRRESRAGGAQAGRRRGGPVSIAARLRSRARKSAG